MGWATLLLAGVGDMTGIWRLDLPVVTAMKNSQAVGQSVEAADEYNKLQKEWVMLNQAISENLVLLKKPVAAYIKQGREHAEKEYATGCTRVEKGLRLIEDNAEKMARFWGR
jgi:hypothetical protein